MVLIGLISVPFVGGLAALVLPSVAVRRLLLAGAALVHAGLTLTVWLRLPALPRRQPSGTKAATQEGGNP